MASTKVVLGNQYERYREILLENLSKIIVYFKSCGTYDPEKFAEINKRVREIQQQQVVLKQKMKDAEQEYRKFFFNSETSDLNPVRGDNGLAAYYTEVYSNSFNKERKLEEQLREIYNDRLWVNSRIIALLTQILEKQTKFLEFQEIVNWPQSEEYKSISRYERDDDDDYGYVEKYASLASQCKEQVDYLCKECLKYKEINGYISMIIAENTKKRTQNAKTFRRTK